MTDTGFIEEPAPPSADRERAPPPPAPRPIGAVNWLGVWTLYAKEVQRFLSVYMQSLFAPVVTTLLFLAVFSLAFAGSGRGMAGVPFQTFLAPGLIMMAIIQASFANNSASILIAKIQGNIVDTLMPPLNAGELTFCYALAGATRGLMVGAIVALGMAAFVDLSVAHAWAVAYFAASTALALSLTGLIGGIWADKFDHMAAVTNFVVTPLAFLSGTFYTVERLPPLWQAVSHANPFFYMIDGFRYGVIGRADGELAVGVALLAVIDLALLALTYHLFRIGWRLKD